MNKRVKNIAISTFFGFIIMGLLSAVFFKHSYYPYRFSFRFNNVLVPFIIPTELTAKFREGNKILTTDAFYVDEVVATNSTNEIEFRGRFYTETAISGIEDRLRQAAAFLAREELTPFVAEKLCVFNFELNHTQSESRILQLLEKKRICARDIQAQLTNDFKVSSGVIHEEGRTKKIIFLSFVVSVFFSGLVYTFLVVRND